MLSLCITPAAQDDLSAIVRASARRGGKKASAAMTGMLLQSMENLPQFPELGAYVPEGELAFRGYRRYLMLKRFWCYYTVSDDTVTIHRVLHKGSGIPLLP